MKKIESSKWQNQMLSDRELNNIKGGGFFSDLWRGYCDGCQGNIPENSFSKESVGYILGWGAGTHVKKDVES